jgi:phosphoribosylpyrophosphate synthetase
MMFAQELAKQIGSSVGDILVKHPFPEKSKQLRTRTRGFEEAEDTSPSPADRRRTNMKALAKVNTDLEHLYNQDLTDVTLEQIEQLESRQAQLQKAIDPAQNKFEKKSLQSMFGSSRRYYDYIRHKEDARHIHEKHIILVDDNIVTGETLAEAVKSFVRQGIMPKVDACVCIHKYM